jgi:outer membrane protein OmpA-like peptidoglycan-associated protein
VLWIGIALIAFAPGRAFAQPQVQWAAFVVDKSSEYHNKEYGAAQALGKPNRMPRGGESTVAWSPYWTDEGQEWIRVGYSTPMKVSQVVIAESFNPGSVTKVILYDKGGQEHLVYDEPARPIPAVARMLHATFPTTSYEVIGVKVVLNTAAVPGFNHIDAIGICPQQVPIDVNINLAKIDFVTDPKNVGTTVNSAYDEVHPLISPDGNTLYFTRKNHPDNLGSQHRDDIWYSTLQEDHTWSPAANLGPPLNSEGHNFINAISPDGNLAMVGGTYIDHSQKDKLFLSHRTSTGWSSPREIEIDDYYNLVEYNSFHVGVDGKTLVMSVKRHDSYGAKDLYVSFQRGDGTWTAPKGLGTAINTAGDEVTPFLAADGRTLYFSSNGFPGYGSIDIYMTKRLDDTWTQWSEPLNLGPKINTPDWDAYYSVPASGNYAYFTSYSNSYGRADIFEIMLHDEVKPDVVAMIYGKVLKFGTEEPIEARIDYSSPSSDTVSGFVLNTPLTGEYKMVVPIRSQYTLAPSAKGYYAVAKTVSIPDSKEYKEYEVILYMYPALEGVVIPLNNIFFAVDSAVLTPESFAELDRCVSFMSSNPGIFIEIGGHTNNQCSAYYCVELSKRRAKAVRDYLIAHGVDPQKVTARGYGKERSIDTNETPEGRKKNQRVEFTILKVN